LLHVPTQRVGLTADDSAAWRAIEEIHDSGKARLIGVSNFSVEQLQSLCEKAQVGPRFVRNRCYANRGWDREVRAFCSANGIFYQSFSLLTANTDALSRADMIISPGATVGASDRLFFASHSKSE
jgi:diketogulonate reductase-like aldo/keto reductase